MSHKIVPSGDEVELVTDGVNQTTNAIREMVEKRREETDSPQICSLSMISQVLMALLVLYCTGGVSYLLFIKPAPSLKCDCGPKQQPNKAISMTVNESASTGGVNEQTATLLQSYLEGVEGVNASLQRVQTAISQLESGQSRLSGQWQSTQSQLKTLNSSLMAVQASSTQVNPSPAPPSSMNTVGSNSNAEQMLAVRQLNASVQAIHSSVSDLMAVDVATQASIERVSAASTTADAAINASLWNTVSNREMFGDWPALLVCRFKDGRVIPFWWTGRRYGSILYRHISSPHDYDIHFNFDQTWSSGSSEQDCYNKNITELYTEGKAINFVVKRTF